MREEYDVKKLKPKLNPYSSKLKQQITINIDTETIQYFKAESINTGIPYQTLINLFLQECVRENKKFTYSFK